MTPDRVGDLELTQDLGWQRRAWTIHRVGWIFLAGFLVAAALGVFGGDGPLRETEAGGEASIQYDRFTRFGSPTELSVFPAPDPAGQGQVQVGVESDYWADFEVQAVTPQPDSVRAAKGEVIYTFLVGDVPGRLDFSLQPRESGVQSGAVRIGEAAPIDFTQIVYP